MSAGRDSTRAGGPPTAPAPGRLPFTLLVVALLGGGLVGQLALNTVLQHGSFERHDLAVHAADLAEQRQQLEQDLARAEDPTTLAERASALGMVASENPVFIRLTDGAVEGTPVQATAPPPPPPTTTPATTPPATAPPATAPPATAPPATAPPAEPPATTETSTAGGQ